jgi:iron complex outermembrane receptor protein
MTSRVRPLIYLALLTSAAAGRPAWRPGDAPQAATGDTDTKDIVVTAQRRRESVQNVNIAVTALSGDALAEKT